MNTQSGIYLYIVKFLQSILLILSACSFESLFALQHNCKTTVRMVMKSLGALKLLQGRNDSNLDMIWSISLILKKCPDPILESLHSTCL